MALTALPAKPLSRNHIFAQPHGELPLLALSGRSITLRMKETGPRPRERRKAVDLKGVFCRGSIPMPHFCLSVAVLRSTHSASAGARSLFESNTLRRNTLLFHRRRSSSNKSARAPRVNRPHQAALIFHEHIELVQIPMIWTCWPALAMSIRSPVAANPSPSLGGPVQQIAGAE